MKNVNWIIAYSIVIIFLSACETKYEEVTVPDLFKIKVPTTLFNFSKEKPDELDLAYGNSFGDSEALVVLHMARKDYPALDTNFIAPEKKAGRLAGNFFKNEKCIKVISTKVNNMKAIQAIVNGEFQLEDEEVEHFCF